MQQLATAIRQGSICRHKLEVGKPGSDLLFGGHAQRLLVAVVQDVVRRILPVRPPVVRCLVLLKLFLTLELIILASIVFCDNICAQGADLVATDRWIARAIVQPNCAYCHYMASAMRWPAALSTRCRVERASGPAHLSEDNAPPGGMTSAL
jgi:hypothetical protein